MYGERRPLPKETKEKYGYSIDELGKHSHKPVITICDNCGIKTNKRKRDIYRKHRCQPIIDGKKYCYKCDSMLPLEDFSKNRYNYSGYQKVCKECFANMPSVKRHYEKKSKEIKEDIEKTLLSRQHSLKHRCKQKNLEYDLPDGYLYKLYQKQKGQCYYTGIKISCYSGFANPKSISVDRKDPSEGYIKNNIVLASNAINNFKSTMSEEQFKEFLELTIPGLVEHYGVT